MDCITFPEVNIRYGPPPGMTEDQVRTVHCWQGYAGRGSCDGSLMVVTAWQPRPEELAALNAGSPVFLTVLGGLPPHFITTNFAEATNPA